MTPFQRKRVQQRVREVGVLQARVRPPTERRLTAMLKRVVNALHKKH